MTKDITINNVDYRLKITTRGCIEAEKRLGKNPVSVFGNVSETNIPTLKDLATIFYVSMKPYQKNIKEEECYDLIDAYIDEYGFKGFIELIVDVLKVSGLVPSPDTEEEELKN